MPIWTGGGSGAVGESGNAGRAWSSAVIYAPGDVVSFEGDSYVALSPTLGSEPGQDPAEWELVYRSGSYKGSGIGYKEGDLVYSSGSIFRAGPNPSADPSASTGSSDWELLGFLSRVRCATTANITLSGSQTIDGVSTSTGMLVLVKNQSTASQNGVYRANNAGSWTRSLVLSQNFQWFMGACVLVVAGSTLAGTIWKTDPVAEGTNIGSANMSWSQVSGSGGGGGGTPGATVTVVGLGAASSGSAGASTAYSRTDHAHALPGPGSASMFVGDDPLDPTSSTWRRVAPSDLEQDGATTGQILGWDGTSWVPGTLNVVPPSRQIIAGTGLSGTGNLASDVTLSVQYGTSGTTACVGNDARLSDPRTPTDNSVSAAKLQDGSVERAKIANNAVDDSKIQNSAVIQSKIAAGAVTGAKLDSTGATEGKTWRYNATTPAWEIATLNASDVAGAVRDDIDFLGGEGVTVTGSLSSAIAITLANGGVTPAKMAAPVAGAWEQRGRIYSYKSNSISLAGLTGTGNRLTLANPASLFRLTDVEVRLATTLSSGASITFRLGTTSGGQEILLDWTWTSATAQHTARYLEGGSVGSAVSASTFWAEFSSSATLYLETTVGTISTDGSIVINLIGVDR